MQSGSGGQYTKIINRPVYRTDATNSTAKYQYEWEIYPNRTAVEHGKNTTKLKKIFKIGWVLSKDEMKKIPEKMIVVSDDDMANIKKSILNHL